MPEEDLEGAEKPGEVRVCVVGRPNVGKSTLINRLLGEERLVAYDQPGTTRDTVEVPFERDGKRYVLIDTAGVRRRAKVEEALEKFSVIKTLQAIDRANVVVGVLDARDCVADQDASLLGLVADRGRALVIAVNKWDHVPPDQRDEIRMQIDLRLRFLDYAQVHFISALHGSGALIVVSLRGGRQPHCLPRELRAGYRARLPPSRRPAAVRVPCSAFPAIPFRGRNRRRYRHRPAHRCVRP